MDEHAARMKKQHIISGWELAALRKNYMRNAANAIKWIWWRTIDAAKTPIQATEHHFCG